MVTAVSRKNKKCARLINFDLTSSLFWDVKQSRLEVNDLSEKPIGPFLMVCLAHEDGTDRLFRNAGN
jgi:hypothetical protein